MEPSKQPLSKLLTIEGTYESYRIPKYQRPYSWGRDDWQQLLDDIEDDSNETEGHFMGSVICVDVSSGTPGDPRIFELIDGQQRLITLSCLLIALWSKFNNLVKVAEGTSDVGSTWDEDDLSDIRSTMDDVRRKILRERRYQSDEKMPSMSILSHYDSDHFYVGRRKRTDYFCRLLPSTQDFNRDDYIYALSRYGLLPDVDFKMPVRWGSRRLARCLSYLFETLPSDFSSLRKLFKRINALVFIHISVNSQADAFRLFEAINNRGVPLSALDIIKNSILATLERSEPGSIDESFKYWSSMTETLGEDSIVHESYLRHFYNAFQFEDKRNVPKHNRATRSTIIRIFESMIKADAKGLLTDLVERATYYAAVTQPEKISIDDQQRRWSLVNLSRVEAKPSHQFLLYLLDREQKGRCSPEETNKIIGLIVSYFVRRNLTGVPATNRLDPLFVELIRRCEERISAEDEALTYDFVRNLILNVPRGDQPSSDQDMRNALMGPIYRENSGLARYLLCHYAETRATDERQVDFWRRTDKGRFLWTIEHVLPQGTPLKSAWVQMLAEGNQEKAADIQDEYKDMLGNLTLSAYNSNLSDASFEKKQSKSKVVLDGEDAYIGYLNGMVLNSLEYEVDGELFSLATAKEWNELHIHARTGVLIESIMKAFPI